MKIAIFDGEGMTLLLVGDVNLLRRNFPVGKISTFLAVGWYSSAYLGFPIKV